jgi:hypothetical protein
MRAPRVPAQKNTEKRQPHPFCGCRFCVKPEHFRAPRYSMPEHSPCKGPSSARQDALKKRRFGGIAGSFLRRRAKNTAVFAV